MKELLQNADDAGSTVFKLCYDARQLPADPSRMRHAGLAPFLGPALLCYNNAVFSDQDFK